jgi:hypothetical protein
MWLRSAMNLPDYETSGDSIVVSPMANILSIDVAYYGKDHFGPVSSRELRICAPFKSSSTFERGMLVPPSFSPQQHHIDYEHRDEFEILEGTICCWLDECQDEIQNLEILTAQLSKRSVVFI